MGQGATMMPLLLLVAAVALGLAAFDVFGQVLRTTGGPFDPALLVTYGWVVLISLLGGVASFYGKVKAGKTRWINLGEFVGELCTSALAGLLMYWMCRWSGLNEWLTAAFVGVAGHMGSRALFLLEKVLERWLERFTAPAAPQAPTPQRGTPGDRLE